MHTSTSYFPPLHHPEIDGHVAAQIVGVGRGVATEVAQVTLQGAALVQLPGGQLFPLNRITMRRVSRRGFVLLPQAPGLAADPVPETGDTAAEPRRPLPRLVLSPACLLFPELPARFTLPVGDHPSAAIGMRTEPPFVQSAAQGWTDPKADPASPWRLRPDTSSPAPVMVTWKRRKAGAQHSPRHSVIFRLKRVLRFSVLPPGPLSWAPDQNAFKETS